MFTRCCVTKAAAAIALALTFTVPLGVGIVGTLSSPAAAFTKIPVGKRTKEYMRETLCKGPGRKYSEGQGQYGCMSNCGDAKLPSDACGINCSEKTNECYGWSPGTEGKKPGTPADVLKAAPADDKKPTADGKSTDSKSADGKSAPEAPKRRVYGPEP